MDRGWLEAEYNLLQKRLDAMYEDKLDGRVAAAYFDRKSSEWRAEEQRILDDVKDYQQANRHYVDSAVEMLDMARVAARSYATADTARKQELIHNVDGCRPGSGVPQTVPLPRRGNDRPPRTHED